jgi:hypothetical protein
MADFPDPNEFQEGAASDAEMARANNELHRTRRKRWRPTLDGGEHIALIAVRKTTAWTEGQLETLATSMEAQYAGQDVDLVKGIVDGTAPEAVGVAPNHALHLVVEAYFQEVATPPGP